MNKEKLLLTISNNMNRISSLTEEVIILDNNSLGSFLKEIEIAGLFSTNLWINNNLDIINCEDFKRRVLAFQEILLDNKYILGTSKLKKAGYISLYLEKGREFKKYIDDYSSDIDNKDKIFEEGLMYIEELLKDKDIRSKEDICHFKLFSNKINNNSNKIDILRTILINQECLVNLEEIMHSLLDEDNNSKRI